MVDIKKMVPNVYIVFKRLIVHFPMLTSYSLHPVAIKIKTPLVHRWLSWRPGWDEWWKRFWRDLRMCKTCSIVFQPCIFRGKLLSFREGSWWFRLVVSYLKTTYGWFSSWWFQPNLKNMLVTLDHFPKDRGEDKICWKPPPRHPNHGQWYWKRDSLLSTVTQLWDEFQGNNLAKNNAQLY